jgi:hypothetical protein
MKQIQDAAAFFFLGAIAVLATISIFGVWELFSSDVIRKSFMTLGLLAFVSVVVMIAGRFIEHKPVSEAPLPLPHPAFKSIRRLTLGVLIAAVSVLALLGVLAIWEVVADMNILYKSLGSVGILAFCAFIMTMTCLEREKTEFSKGRNFGIGSIVVALILVWMLLSVVASFF